MDEETFIVIGRIFDERFATMSMAFEEEQQNYPPKSYTNLLKRLWYPSQNTEMANGIRIWKFTTMA